MEFHLGFAHAMISLMFKEFKEFISRGNVVDLAVGVIIGGAFGKIISSLVTDIILPPFSIIQGKINFADRFISVSGKSYRTLADAKEAGAATVNYGLFINNVVEFIIIAFALFLVIKQINRFRRQPPKDPTEKECPFCFSKISIKATKCPNCTSKL